MQKGSRGTLILVIGILSMASATYFAAYLLVISSFAPISEPVQSIALTVVSCFQGRSREPTAGGLITATVLAHKQELQVVSR